MPESFVTESAADVYRWVHHALQWGMWLSTALYALGVIRALQHPVPLALDAVVTQSFGVTLRGVFQLDPSSLMLAATVVLILTPVSRVIVALGVFWRDHDHRFVLVTGAVLAILVLTVILGLLGLH